MAAFGTEFADQFVTCRFADGAWGSPQLEPLGPLSIHPAAHVLHYASTCFEGFKAYKWADGKARVFRLDDHVQRMRASARSLHLPEPPADTLKSMVFDVVNAALDRIPAPPGALYLRPTLIGLTPNIGAAAAPATDVLLYILASPVGDYFAGGVKPLRILVDDSRHRTAEHLGSTKTGGNYAAALGPTLAAKAEYGVDQVLFCPNGDVQETGAANFMLLDDGALTTKPLGAAFLHGVTRASILTLAADHGMHVDERDFTVAELLDAVAAREAALSGTAACLTPIGTLVHAGRERSVRDGEIGPTTERLRAALCAIHDGSAEDRHHWLTDIEG
ncbi:MAG: branched-chain amino acid aminotransferase [Pseudomonadota bacterium]